MYTTTAWTAPSTRRSPDWIYSEASNTHLTNDSSWFEDGFVSFESEISNSRASIANIPVKGVGTVTLPVQQSLAGVGTGFQSSLRLENVLYVPDYPCNIIGNPIKAVVSIQFSSLTPRGAMIYGDGSIAAIFQPGKDFYQVMLRESSCAPPLGPSALDEHPEYGHMVAFTWSGQEQQRWMNVKAASMSHPRMGGSCASEFKFSLAHDLDVNAMQGIQLSSSTQRSSPARRKRGAPDDADDSDARRFKRTRVFSGEGFVAGLAMPTVFPTRA